MAVCAFCLAFCLLWYRSQSFQKLLGNHRTPRCEGLLARWPLTRYPGFGVCNAIHVRVVLDIGPARIREIVEEVRTDDVAPRPPDRAPTSLLQKLLSCHDLVEILQTE